MLTKLVRIPRNPLSIHPFWSVLYLFNSWSFSWGFLYSFLSKSQIHTKDMNQSILNCGFRRKAQYPWEPFSFSKGMPSQEVTIQTQTLKWITPLMILYLFHFYCRFKFCPGKCSGGWLSNCLLFRWFCGAVRILSCTNYAKR